ncbi:MAG: hypothetical protein ACPH5J_04810 [Candidatus Puniceispirillum sp.]
MGYTASANRAEATAYVELVAENGSDVRSIFSTDINAAITMVPIRAVISALNKLQH